MNVVTLLTVTCRLHECLQTGQTEGVLTRQHSGALQSVAAQLALQQLFHHARRHSAHFRLFGYESLLHADYTVK